MYVLTFMGEQVSPLKLYAYIPSSLTPQFQCFATTRSVPLLHTYMYSCSVDTCTCVWECACVISQFGAQLQVLSGESAHFSHQLSLKRQGGGRRTSDLKTGPFHNSHTPPSLKRCPCVQSSRICTTIQCVWLLGYQTK